MKRRPKRKRQHENNENYDLVAEPSLIKRVKTEQEKKKRKKRKTQSACAITQLPYDINEMIARLLGRVDQNNLGLAVGKCPDMHRAIINVRREQVDIILNWLDVRCVDHLRVEHKRHFTHVPLPCNLHHEVKESTLVDVQSIYINLQSLKQTPQQNKCKTCMCRQTRTKSCKNYLFWLHVQSYEKKEYERQDSFPCTNSLKLRGATLCKCKCHNRPTTENTFRKHIDVIEQEQAKNLLIHANIMTNILLTTTHKIKFLSFLFPDPFIRCLYFAICGREDSIKKLGKNEAKEFVLPLLTRDFNFQSMKEKKNADRASRLENRRNKKEENTAIF